MSLLTELRDVKRKLVTLRDDAFNTPRRGDVAHDLNLTIVQIQFAIESEQVALEGDKREAKP
jgi:hypothetical protein